MVRRADRQGEVLVWCRKCPGCARQILGPKSMDYCKPEHVGTKEYGKTLRRIQILEDGRVPAKEEAKNCRTECRRVCDGRTHDTEGLWNLAR